MGLKFKKGDYFIHTMVFNPDFPITTIGKVTVIKNNNRGKKCVYFHVIEYTGAYWETPPTYFTIPSPFYENARIITEAEAVARLI